MGQILHTVPRWRKAYKMRTLVFVERKSDVAEEKRRVSLLLENLRIDAELIVLSMDSGKFPSYEILVNGAKTTDAIDNALRNESWWTERHQRAAEAPHSHHHYHHHKRDSSMTNNIAMRKSRTNSNLPHSSVPLSFRTNIPMPSLGDSSTDSESESESEDENQGSVLIMPKYSDSAVIDDDEESVVGMRSRKASGAQSNSPDFDASPLPAKTMIQHAEMPLNTANVPDTASSSKGKDMSSRNNETPDESSKPSISFAPPPSAVQHRNSGFTSSKIGFNDLPAKAQHLIINDLIKSQSQHTGVLFTTLPPPPAGTYKDERKSENYLEGLAILCDLIPPCILIHSKSLTVTTAL